MFAPSTFFTVKSGVHLLDGYYDDIVEFTRAPVTHSLINLVTQYSLPLSVNSHNSRLGALVQSGCLNDQWGGGLLAAYTRRIRSHLKKQQLYVNNRFAYNSVLLYNKPILFNRTAQNLVCVNACVAATEAAPRVHNSASEHRHRVDSWVRSH